MPEGKDMTGLEQEQGQKGGELEFSDGKDNPWELQRMRAKERSKGASTPTSEPPGNPESVVPFNTTMVRPIDKKGHYRHVDPDLLKPKPR